MTSARTGVGPKADVANKDASNFNAYCILGTNETKDSQNVEDIIYESPLSGDAVSIEVEDEAPL